MATEKVAIPKNNGLVFDWTYWNTAVVGVNNAKAFKSFCSSHGIAAEPLGRNFNPPPPKGGGVFRIEINQDEEEPWSTRYKGSLSPSMISELAKHLYDFCYFQTEDKTLVVNSDGEYIEYSVEDFALVLEHGKAKQWDKLVGSHRKKSRA